MSFWSNPFESIEQAISDPSKAVTNATKPITEAFDDVLKNGLNAKPSNVFIVAGDPLGSDVKKIEANDPGVGALGAGIASYFSLGIGGDIVAEGNRRERGDKEVRQSDITGSRIGGTIGAIYGDSSPTLSKVAPIVNLLKPRPSSNPLINGQSSDNYFMYSDSPSVNYSQGEEEIKDGETAGDNGGDLFAKAGDSTLTKIVGVMTLIAIFYQLSKEK